MSRQQKLILLTLVGTILTGLLVGVCLAAAARKRSSKPAPIIKHPVETSPDDALKYWTKDRMRKAKPAPLPDVKDLDRRKKPRRRPPHTSDQAQD